MLNQAFLPRTLRAPSEDGIEGGVSDHTFLGSDSGIANDGFVKPKKGLRLSVLFHKERNFQHP